MRNDSVGLFWDDAVLENNKKNKIRRQPPIPETGWEIPKEFPNLAAAEAISIDVETYDPNMKTLGPGWARNDGHLVGISVGTVDGNNWYFPMRHEIEPENNLDPEHVLNWARDNLCNKHQAKIGANIMYDIGWLEQEGVHVKGKLYDVQYAEALLDEHARSYALERLGQVHLNEGKESNELYEWCSKFYGGKPNGGQRANIHRAPARLVGPYAESDASLPMRIFLAQYPLLIQQNLLELFEMECDLIPMLMAMRFKGVRVDLNVAERVRDELRDEELKMQQELNQAAGRTVDVYSGESIAAAFDSHKLTYPRTALGAPSFVKEWLLNHDSEIAQKISAVRRADKTRSTFVEGYILDKNVDGRLHCQFHPLRSDSGGTVSGRYSSSMPNLQNIPARDPILGPLIRGMFVPDEGCDTWVKIDYSQIEYRLLSHYALGEGADRIRQLYNDKPETDFHEATQALILEVSGMDIGRKATKNVNFGLVYGMAQGRLARQLGLSKAASNDLFGAYHAGSPFVKQTFEHYVREAQQAGVITTLLGRRARFELYETLNGYSDAYPFDEAVSIYGQVKRAYGHKALNRLLQGGAADLMKKAMLDLYNSGILDDIGMPHLTVHDELDWSIDKETQMKYFPEAIRIMQDAIPLKIPVLADIEAGPDWGHVQEYSF